MILDVRSTKALLAGLSVWSLSANCEAITLQAFDFGLLTQLLRIWYTEVRYILGSNYVEEKCKSPSGLCTSKVTNSKVASCNTLKNASEPSAPQKGK